MKQFNMWCVLRTVLAHCQVPMSISYFVIMKVEIKVKVKTQ